MADLWNRYGLSKTNNVSINFAEGNFNTQFVRYVRECFPANEYDVLMYIVCVCVLLATIRKLQNNDYSSHNFKYCKYLNLISTLQQ